MRWAWRALAWMLAVGLGGSTAFGQESSSGDSTANTENRPPDGDSAESLLAQGVEYRKRHEDRLARTAFERAWTLGKAPRALAQLALAEQALGHWREAHEHLEAALEHSEDEWIAAHRTTLDVALREIASRLGAVEISCNVDGAEVRVDGRVVGRTPLERPVRVAAGNTVVQILADGYYDALRQTQVDAAALARVDVVLTRLAPPAPSSASEHELSPAPELSTTRGSENSPAPLAANRGAQPETSPREVLTYTSAGLAALGATVGVTGYVIREVNVRLYNDNERCAAVLGTPRSKECESEFAAWRRGEIIAIAGSAAAGVFGLTALYLWWSGPDAHDDPTALSCSLGLGSLTCSRAF